jgi:hypothetical protein
MSVFLVASAATVFAVAMPVATVGRGKAKYQQRAVNFSNKQIELVRSMGYANINPQKLAAATVIDSDQPVASDTYSCNTVDQAHGDRISDAVPNGNATLKIEQIDQELKRVTVKVTWQENQRSREFELGTLVANL